MDKNFWKNKNLHEMSQCEWESLCDRCGLCCLHKIENDETNEIFYTNVVCRLFDIRSCCCGNYKMRKKMVPDCNILTPDKVYKLDWLPATCAYRLIASGQELEVWHPLISKTPNSVHKAGISLKGKLVIPESKVKDLKKHIVSWLR